MRKPLAIILFLVGSASVLAADAGPLLAQAKAAEARCDPATALPLYLALLRARPDDPEIMLKVARQHSDLADSQPTAAKKQAEVREALGYVEQAVRLNPKSAVAELSLAICHGKLAAWSEHARDKIAYSRLVQEEAQRALVLDPRYAWADDILGQWNCALASLSGTERFFVTVLYGGLPAASYDQGIADLRRAVALEPGEPAHRVELGFAYLAVGQRPAAREEFSRGLALPAHAPSDNEEKARAQAELAKLGPAPRADKS
jgi:tetratricopeptide (TPR) repeat protein